MEKTSDTIVNELFKSLDVEVPHVSETESILSVSCAKLPKMHKKHKKSKKHKKHKKKSKKSKKSKKRSHSKCSEDSVELKIDKDKLEEVKSGMPVTLDAVLETIVVTANEESEEFQNNLCIPQKNSSVEEPSTKQTTVDIKDDTTNVSNTNSATINNNSKIVIKDLKGSRVYHDLLNKVHETEILEAEKYEEVQSSSCGMDINIKIKKGKHKSHKSKKKKRSRSRDRSRSSKRPKRDRSHSRNRKRSRSPVLSHKNDHVHNDFNGNSSSKHDSHRNHQHRSRSRDKNSSNSRGKKENRSRSQDKFEASKSTKRSRTPDYDTKEKISRFSRSREYEKTRRRSRSKDLSSKSKRHRSPSCEKIDKKKLFKIARKNALSLVQQGMLPVGSVKKETLANIPTKSVDELTDFCRKLSKKEKDHENESSSSMSEDETKQPFHHPFLVKDRPNIVLNIRNSTQLPVKSFQEKTVGQDMLRLQFPVSSGQTHSLAVNEWMPIGAEESAKLNKISRPSEIAKPNKTPNQLVPLKVVTVEPVQQTSSIQTAVTSPKNDSAPIVPQQYPAICEPTPISKNLYANSGYSMLSYETGQFTGHTGAKILTPAELATGYQPWVKKDQLKNTAPVNSGMGMHLLQKMGWKPGEGLGKNQSGSLEPLLLDVKMDKKGLVSAEEENRTAQAYRASKRFPKKSAAPVLSLEEKHPVSLLNEFCAKRKWDVPKFDTVDESGPSHRKSFVMAAIVNGVKYCSSRCQTKKLAKLDAAKVCLKEIGLLT